MAKPGNISGDSTSSGKLNAKTLIMLAKLNTLINMLTQTIILSPFHFIANRYKTDINRQPKVQEPIIPPVFTTALKSTKKERV